MVSLWIPLIAILTLALALLLKYLVSDVIEEDNVFLGLIGIFLMIYVLAAVAISWMNPPLEGHANIASITDTIRQATPDDQ